MHFHHLIGYLMVLPWFVMSQMTNIDGTLNGSPVLGVISPNENSLLQSTTIVSNLENNQISPMTSNERYLVGNLSESFTFQVAPPSIKITYLGLNGLSLYITGVGFSNQSKFNYDEKQNRLTILSLDATTVGYYSAVDTNWKTYDNIISAINVSSFHIDNSHVSEDNNGSSLVSCSVSIIHSTFKLPDTISRSKSSDTDNLPHLDLYLSTRTSSSIFLNNKIYNDTSNGQNFTRTITIPRPLTRADHNGTIECQVQSNNNLDVYLTKIVPIDIEYGPNLETGALPTFTVQSQILKPISLECQIEANPTPSYVWYEMLSNTTVSQNVFGTTRTIEKIYQYPDKYSMQCQAQSRGKTVKQQFFITVYLSTNEPKIDSLLDESPPKSNKIPIIIGIVVASILLLLVAAIIIAVIIYYKRRKTIPNDKQSITAEKASNDKQGKSRWGGLPIDYTKYKHESLKTDSSSTSQLVEAAETPSNQQPPPSPPPIPVRPSPMTSTQSSYRQPPSTTVSLSYRQATALPGFRSTMPQNNYDEDDGNTSFNAIPLTINRTRTGSHKSLSESIQSLRSNQQPSISLPMKKRSNDLIKHEDKFLHNNYQNLPLQNLKTDNTSSEEEEFERQQQQQQQIISTQLPPGIHHDEVPPSYQQITHTPSPSHAYIYHEPTEV